MEILEVLYVSDKGDINKERIVLKATQSFNLIKYALINSYSEDGQSCYDLNDKIFWFPDQIINPGEYIRVYTKAGQKETHNNGKFKGEAAVFHDFFWGKTNPIWIEKSNTVVVLDVQKFHIKKV